MIAAPVQDPPTGAAGTLDRAARRLQAIEVAMAAVERRALVDLEALVARFELYLAHPEAVLPGVSVLPDPVAARLQAQRDALASALEIVATGAAGLTPTAAAPVVPLVRPPAPAVPAPPVELPRVPTPDEQPAAARRGGGRPGSVDYAEVARVANEARAADLPAREAVAKHFGIGINAAAWRLKTARANGHDIRRSSRGVRAVEATVENLAEVARIAKAASGISPAQAVAAHFEVHVTTARVLLRDAEAAGHRIPKPNRGGWDSRSNHAAPRTSSPPAATRAPASADAPSAAAAPVSRPGVAAARPAVLPKPRPPLDEIAAVVDQARRDGAPVIEAIATHFDVDTARAKRWRQLVAATPGVVEHGDIAGPPAGVTWEEIAAEYSAARDANRPPITALIEAFDVDRDVAKRWPAECRRLGLLAADISGQAYVLNPAV